MFRCLGEFVDNNLEKKIRDKTDQLFNTNLSQTQKLLVSDLVDLFIQNSIETSHNYDIAIATHELTTHQPTTH
mgnify:CR=1 FL=1